MQVVLINLSVSAIFLASIYILIGVGLSLLYGVSQTINLAHGDFMVVGAYLTFFFVSTLKFSPIWMVLITPVVMSFVGMLIYKAGGFSAIINRDISRTDREYTTMIMAFALAWIVTNLLATVFTTNPQTYPIVNIQYLFSNFIPFRKLISIVLAIIVLGIIMFIIKKTWIGLAIRCVFDDNDASKLMGINVDKVHFITFFLAFFSAGLAGSLYSMNYAINPYIGTELTIIAIVVTIIGGIGSVKGAITGAIIVALVETLVLFFVAPLLKIALVYALFVVILLFRPSGLFKSM